MESFKQAFHALLSLAPGPVFPRARELYLRKYCLEGRDAKDRFRTFLFEEQIQESDEGGVQVMALSFAVVHWHAAQSTPEEYATYLQQRWQLQPDGLSLEMEPWFREGGAFARFRAAALYESSPVGEFLMGGT
ncbi:MAG: hypothetical protein O2839_04095 [Cyanobacteria bacterium]|nr:hypothetical protein [Cyanobacteriota bacterium]MDA1246064.1 hypothetical protein [Cyanobacteriota bacterium]